MFKYFSNISLKAQISLLIVLASVFMSLVFSYFIYLNAFNAVMETAKQSAQVQVQAIGEKIDTELETALIAARTTAEIFSGGLAMDSLNLKPEQALLLLTNVILSNDAFVGMSTIWEADAYQADNQLFNPVLFDRQGRFIPYLSKDIKGHAVVEPLLGYDDKHEGTYYLLPKKTLNELITEPYVYPVQNVDILMTTLSAPILIKQKFAGIVTVDVALEWLQTYIEKQELYGENTQLLIISNSGILAAHSAQAGMVGRHIKSLALSWEELLNNFREGKQHTQEIDGILSITVPIEIGNTRSNWGINIQIPTHEIAAHTLPKIRQTIFLSLSYLFLLVSFILLIINYLLSPLKELALIANRLLSTRFTEVKLPAFSGKEFVRIGEAFNNLLHIFKRNAEFVENMQKGNIDVEFSPTTKHDFLASALLAMREKLKNARRLQDERARESQRMNWLSEGLTKFADLLRQYADNQKDMAKQILNNLLEYIQANQGGFYILKTDQSGKVLELLASYAYNQERNVKKIIPFKTGLVGNCAAEKKAKYITNIPDNYLKISSSLGSSKAQNLLLVPLLFENRLFGVIEIASFRAIEKYEIEFVESVAERIASVLSNLSTSERTSKLLQESRMKSETLMQQEISMRQNLEKLKEEQLKLANNQAINKSFIDAINYTVLRADFDLSGKLLDVNPRFFEKLKLKQTDVTNQGIYNLVSSEKPVLFKEKWEKLLASGQFFEEEIRFITHAGNYKWFLATFTAVKNPQGEIEKILLLAIDIDDRKRINLEFEGEIKAINSTSLKAEFSPTGEIILLNDKLLDAFQYNREELIGQQIFDFLPADDRKEFMRHWKKINQGKARGLLSLFHTKKGEKRWLQGHFTPVADFQGTIYKIIYIANDVSQQKEMEFDSHLHSEALIAQGEAFRENLREIDQLNSEIEKLRAENKQLKHLLDM